MSNIKFPVNAHEYYHAHIYFEHETLQFAIDLCKTVGQLFGLEVGRVHQKEVGPHPKWSCQIIFSSKEFDNVIPWLERNRQGLSVLVHGVTGDNLLDHTEYAYWLGEEMNLKLAMFQ